MRVMSVCGLMFFTSQSVSFQAAGRVRRRGSARARERRHAFCGLARSAVSLSLALVCGCVCGCSEPSYGNSEDIGGAGRGPSSAVQDGGNTEVRHDAARDGSGPGSSVTSPGDAGGVRATHDAGTPIGPSESSPPDVTTPVVPLPDGGADTAPPALPVLPQWARPLVGQYASRGYTFKQDEFGTITRLEELSHADISANESGGLTLVTKFCSSVATTTIAELRLKNARALPDRIETLVLSESDQHWSSMGPKVAAGFTREPPAFCAGMIGQDVTKAPEQVWLEPSTTCRCASAAEDPLSDDCRVLDPDHDQKPGLTYELRGMTTSVLNATLYAGAESSARYTNGVIGADGTRHTANIVSDDKAYQFDCEPRDCANIAVLGKFCPESQNRVSFVRLPDQAQKPTGADPCVAILAERRTLFPEAPLAYPPRCYQ